MKIILSRKGFDSANGVIASPIFEDGTMFSFPIPKKCKSEIETSSVSDCEKCKYKCNCDIDLVRYSDLRCGNISVEDILEDLGYFNRKANRNNPARHYCHMDPDLCSERRKMPVDKWKAGFGQINQAAKYLDNCKVGEDKGSDDKLQDGDLFLFFGNFRHVEKFNGKYRYVRPKSGQADPYYGKTIQAIWGYLQVDKVLRGTEVKDMPWHPHSCEHRIFDQKHNMIYTATDKLSFNPNFPGCGLFSYDVKRVLSMIGNNKGTWKYNAAYDDSNLHVLGNSTGRKKAELSGDGIYYPGIWQELVLEENSISEEWAKTLF